MAFSHAEFDTYSRKWSKAMKGIKSLKENFAWKTAEEFLKKCQEVTPYVTGTLHDGWYITNVKIGTYHSSVDVDNDAVNKNGEYYGSWVEDGFTHWITGIRFEGHHMSQIAAAYINRKARHRWTDAYRYWLKKNGLY